MVIIQPTQTMLKLFGYLVSYSQSRWYVVYRYTTYVFTWNLVYPMVNFTQDTEPSYVVNV